MQESVIYEKIVMIKMHVIAHESFYLKQNKTP